MRRLFPSIFSMMLAAAMGAAQPASGQVPAVEAYDPSGIDPSSIPLPRLDFEPTAQDRSNYDKYFYFNRADTDFATAYADLQECDGYARGLTYRVTGGGYHGALGNIMADAIADAIHGSAERRRQRRSIMRTCMRFKGYRAYGLRKSLWEAFNFEEGNARIEESERQHRLQVQARVASGPQPRAEAIGQ
jgi:hypothetical protein